MKMLLRTVAAVLLLWGQSSEARIDGLTGTNFNLVARIGQISTADGHSLRGWGYAPEGGLMQYPGPTLIVNEGDTVTVTLRNELPEPVSIVFPGQSNVTAIGGNAGLLTQEAPSDGVTTVTYVFTAAKPGTYLYQSGTRQELQVEMGLFGALIVRPAGQPQQAYGHAATAFDREYLFVVSEIDPHIHELAEFGRLSAFDNSRYWPTLWFFNGRNTPDTMAPAGSKVLKHQPYNCMPQMHPGERVLMRVVGAGRDLHPLHTHGNHQLVIARDGRMLESAPGAGPDLAVADYTVNVIPGGTYDAIFEWTGKGLGWDIYGHTDSSPATLEHHEWAPDHGKPLPTMQPEKQSMSFGRGYSGSPFLGTVSDLPGAGGVANAGGGMYFMFHSHNEKEMASDDVFPGGMMTMMMVEPHGVMIE